MVYHLAFPGRSGQFSCTPQLFGVDLFGVGGAVAFEATGVGKALRRCLGLLKLAFAGSVWVEDATPYAKVRQCPVCVLLF